MSYTTMKQLITSLCIVLSLHAAATDHTASTIEEANTLLTKANSGDKIILKDGSYNNAAIKFKNTNVTFVAEHAGKVFLEGDSYIWLAGSNNTVSGFVFRNGGHTLKNKQVIQFRINESEFATHSRVEDCVIDQYNNDDKETVNTWVGLYGEYNTVTHCLFRNKDNKGPTLVVWLQEGKAAHHTVSYNYFWGRQNGANADNGLESIRVGDSKTSMTDAHCVVAFNRFEECDGEIEIISNKSCHNTYLHNTFYNCDGGLTLRHGNRCLADGNFFDGANKPKSYGVRIIGEGHAVINNYFYHLNGSPTQAFRAPVTVVNGLANTPINGYFQVKTAYITSNVFVNCVLPDIRIGAYSKREGMTVAPDSVLVNDNLFYDDAGKVGDAFESLTDAQHLTMKNNKAIGEYLKANAKGITQLSAKGVTRNEHVQIKDAKGNILSSASNRIENNYNAGADVVDAMLAKEAAKTKYSFVTPAQVGPQWMQ